MEGGMIKKRFIIALSGATGSIYGVRLLEMLRALGDYETHLVVSQAGFLNASHELGLSRKEIEAKADVVHANKDIGASIASGSFVTQGMIVAPCSMKTLSAVAYAFADNLITRAADVVLKERRKLVLVTRETPLNLAHIKAMQAVTEMGGIIYPPVPSLYNRPQSLDEMVNHTCGRILDLFAIEHDFTPRWGGLSEKRDEH